MENQDIDLVGQTVGNMFYKVGIIDKDGKLINQFVAKASTNRVDIPQSALGAGEGNAQNSILQLPVDLKLFSGLAVGNSLLTGPSTNYDNVQDGLLITLSNLTESKGSIGGHYDLSADASYGRIDLSSIGLKQIKIPKEKLIVNSSFDISDQLSQYIGKTVQGQYYENNLWNNINSKFSFSIVSFGGTTIQVLPNTTISMNLTVHVKYSNGLSNDNDAYPNDFKIPVIQVSAYKN